MGGQRISIASALPTSLAALALLVVAIGALSNAQSRDGGAREKLFDAFERVAPLGAQRSGRFHIIEIDEETLRRVGPWPWPRSVVADVIDAARAGGARSAIFVEPVDAPDPLSPTSIGEFYLNGARDAALADQLAALDSTDVALGRALGDIQGAYVIAPAGDADASFLKTSAVGADRGDWIDVLDGADLAPPPGETRIALPAARPRFPVDGAITAAGTRSVGRLSTDGDGLLRAPALLWAVDGDIVPSTALVAAIAAVDAAPGAAAESARPSLILDPARTSAEGRAPGAVTLAGRRLPVDGVGRVAIGWPKTIETEATPAWRLLTDGSSHPQLADKVVLIGRDIAGGGAVRTPRGPISQAAAHAVIADSLLSVAVARRPAWAGYAEALAAILIGAAAIMWSQRAGFWRSASMSAIAALAALAASAAAYQSAGMSLNPLPAIWAAALTTAIIAAGRSFGVAIADDKLRGKFKGALPEPTLRKLREEGAADVLDGSKRDITILSCELSLLDSDLRRFAGRPAEVTSLIASACAALRQEIVDMGGAVDQSDGGKVLGYFNAPLETADHARAACTAALRLVESMDKINAELDVAGDLSDLQLHLAIGVAGGECFIGPMGYGRANRYSAIGEPVRVAGFLRRQAAYYGPAIIVEDAVYRKTHHNFAFLELDRVQPREASRPFSIFALVGNPFLKSSKSFRALDAAHRDMLAAYRAGDYQAAKLNLIKARRSPGASIALFDIYEERLAAALDADAADQYRGGAVPVTL